MAGVLAYAINPRWMSWSSWPLPVWLRWLGVVLGALAAGLIFWTFRHLGPNLTDTVVTRKEHTLVTSGPYQYVRHPFYVAFILAVVANALTTANWFLLLTGAAAWLFVVLRTPREEAKLVERFGQAYRDYRDQTGMLFPHLSRRRKAHD
jgi:protein-S-isoprenylcysteine O-methyltransferase Ste14